jgi:hypothetical protein
VDLTPTLSKGEGQSSNFFAEFEYPDVGFVKVI